MATVETIYKTSDSRVAALRISIAGSQLPNSQILGIDYSFGVALVPTATIRLRGPLPAAAIFRATVTVDKGFNGVYLRQFTGRLYHIDPDERGYTLECMGQSWVLDVPYHDIIYTFDNVTAEAAITDLLTQAGASAFTVDVAAWTIGTRVLSLDPDRAKVTLEFQTYGEAVTKVAEKGGHRWFETPDGVIRVRRMDGVPALSAAHEFFSMALSAGPTETYPAVVAQTIGGLPARPRVRAIRAEQQVRDVKNRVVVKGATYEQVNADGTVDGIDIEAEAQAPSPWIRNEDGTQAYNTELYSNELLDQVADAQEEAGRRVSVLNRLNDRMTLVVDGCPFIALGQTLYVADPSYSGREARYVVEAYATSMAAGEGTEAGEDVTTITLIGGSEAGGEINVSPFAVFSHTVEREVIGDRVWAVVTLDARGSVDADGTIASYAWSGDVTGSGAVLYARVDPTLFSDNKITVTLTVTDNLGATDAITLEIDIAAGTGGVFIPALFVAGDTHFSASPDGGINWNDQALGGGDSVISVGARANDGPGTEGIAVYGTNLGKLYRTTDSCLTAPTLVLAAVGSPFVRIGRGYLQDHSLMWALTLDARLYRSDDSGVTWGLWENLRTYFGLPGLIGWELAVPAVNGIWVFGGDGAGRPFIAYDAAKSHVWTRPALGGELLADVPVGGDNGLYIASYGSVGTGDMCILLNSSTEANAVYFTPTIFGDGSAWKRATGAIPAKTRGRWMTAESGVDAFGRFQFGYDDNIVYLGDVTVGGDVVNVTVAAAAMDAADDGNDGVAIGDIIGGVGGAHIVAAEGAADGTLYKTWDRFASIAKLRPATGFDAPPAGWNAKQVDVAIGSLGPTGLDERLVAVGTDVSPREFTKLLGVGATDWSGPTAMTGLTGSFPFLRAVDEDVMFAWPWDTGDSPGQGGQGVGIRSKDGGATWSATPDPGINGGGVIDFARDAGGRLWCLYLDDGGPRSVTKFARSDDDGDTWETVGTVSNGSTYDRGWQIMCHPTNANIVAAVGVRGFITTGWIAYTTNAQAPSPTFTINTNAALRYGSDSRSRWEAIMLPVGGTPRILVTRIEGTHQYYYRTENWGVTITQIFDFSGAALFYAHAGFGRNFAGDTVGFFLRFDNGSTLTVTFYLSTDGGNSFAATALSQEYTAFISPSTPGDFGVAYDPLSSLGTMYLRSDATKKVAKFAPLSAQGVFTDLTSDYPHAANNWKNLSWIPRP